MINDEEEEPVDWKLYFASLTDRKLYDFWEIIKKEMANRNWKNLPEPTQEEIEVGRSERIKGIKMYRQRTGAGLSDAMKMIDKFR